MNQLHERASVLEQLESALEAGHIPDEGKRRAAQILSRLNSPVQIVVIGHPGTGKSHLINMLVGQSVAPEAANQLPLEITYGPTARILCINSDGSQEVLGTTQLENPAPPDTVILRVETPLEKLQQFTLTELDLKGSLLEQKAIAEWATSRADIVLWCSQSFDPDEQTLWSSAPDELKDHSFLVMTRADELERQGVLSERIAQLSEIVSEEFYRMYPVATLQAISAGFPDGSRDEDAWTSSGGRAMANAVNKLVATGRRADMDNALVFLNRYAPDISSPDQSANVSHQAPDATGDVTPKPERQSQSEPRPNDTATGTFRHALAFLEKRADLMLGVVAGNRPDKPAHVLEHCLETSDKLSEIVMEIENANPPYSEIQEDIMECSDMMVLFHLEKTENAATDAVTLLLQLKKEMSLAVAA